MQTFVGEVNDVYPLMVQTCAKEGSRVPSRVSDTIELHPAVAEFTNPTKRLVTSYGRPVNVPFALAEVVWILSGRQDVAFLDRYNSRIADYSDDGVTFNAAYGHRLRHAHGHDQLVDVIQLLKRDQGTRQATLAIWHSDDRAHEMVHIEGGDPFLDLQSQRMVADRACNLLAHLMIRDGKLNWLQVMRSNDAIWGMPYNLMQWTYLHEYVAAAVGVEVGVYRYVGDSFHIYDYHEDEAATIAPYDLYGYTGWKHSPMTASSRDLDAAVELCAGSRSVSDRNYSECGQWVRDFAQIWGAWHSYKAGDDGWAMRSLTAARDRVYAAATARFFWFNRWHKQDVGMPDNFKLTAHFGSNVADWICSGSAA